MEFRRSCLTLMGVMALAGVAWAMPADLKDLDATLFERLRAKASDHVEVNLEGPLLKIAASFISSTEGVDAAKLKKLVGGLTSVAVRNFEFKRPGDFSASDVDAIRNQIKSSQWKRMVEAVSKSEGERSEVYVLPGTGDKLLGLIVLTAEPTELTVVHITGEIDPKDIETLEHLQVPGDDK